MEDSDIIELYWHRSEAAILETKKKYHKLCSHIADNILHSREDSEECVQDTYLAVWNRIPEERPHYLRAFVCKITRNISLNRLDHKRAARRDEKNTVSFEELEETFSVMPNFSENIEWEELTIEINRFLSKLPVNKRVILVRRYFFGDSIAEIASDLNMNINSVKTILRRENRKLREYLRRGGYGK